MEKLATFTTLRADLGVPVRRERVDGEVEAAAHVLELVYVRLRVMHLRAPSGRVCRTLAYGCNLRAERD